MSDDKASMKFSVVLPVDLVNRLDLWAKEHERNRMGEMRYALRQYLDGLDAGVALRAAQTVTTPVAVGPAAVPPAAVAPTPAPAVPAAAVVVPARAAEDPELAAFIGAARELGDWKNVSPEEGRAGLAAWHAAMTVAGPRETRPVEFHASGYTGVRLLSWLVDQFGGMPEPTALTFAWPKEVYRTYSFVNGGLRPERGQAVTEIDVISQYTAAARSALLGDGEPATSGPVAVGAVLDRVKLPGMVLIGSAPDLSEASLPARLAFGRLQPGQWLPNPAAVYLVRDHKVALDVAESIYWPGKVDRATPARFGKRLDRWAQVISDGQAALLRRAPAAAGAVLPPDARLALDVLKLVRSKFLGGMLNSEDNHTDTYRPDWYDQVVAQANANMLRAVDRGVAAGAIPLGVQKDSVWYLSDPAAAPYRPPGLEFPDPRPSAEKWVGPGKWSVRRWGLVDRALEDAHRTCRPATLRDAVAQVSEAREAAAGGAG